MFRALFFSVWVLFHPVHVTLTSIDYVAEVDSFKVFVKMYFDDFISDNRLEGIEIAEKDFTPVNSSAFNSMESYLERKVIIRVNDKKLTGKIQSMSLADNEVSLNISYSGNKKPVNVTVQNMIMIRLYSDMSNMILIRVNSFEEGVKLTSDMTEKTFKIN